MLSRSAAIIVAVIGVVSTTIAMVVVVITGNTSFASVTPAAVTTFPAVSDTYVDSSTPTTNYGTSTQLKVDGSPVDRTFLKFTVSGLADPVTNARLRIHTTDIQSAARPGARFRRSATLPGRKRGWSGTTSPPSGRRWAAWAR